jgi:hypothetical protein
MAACAQNIKKIALILAREGVNGSKIRLDRFQELLRAILSNFFTTLAPKQNQTFGSVAII